jgi:hypothetical protein
MSLYTYDEAINELGNKISKKVSNNTYLELRNSDGVCVAVRLHQTDVVTFYPNGTKQLATGGWFSVTTRDRLNQYINGRVSFGKGSRTYSIGGFDYEFKSGMMLGSDDLPDTPLHLPKNMVKVFGEDKVFNELSELKGSIKVLDATQVLKIFKDKAYRPVICKFCRYDVLALLLNEKPGKYDADSEWKAVIEERFKKGS